mmetsp:Transcript_2772/g.4670  ORF Transcript_2772/g.4670 Transcript_2772/m.4670 type:complete len:107 (+) Transcript_2772:780-1100(+)
MAAPVACFGCGGNHKKMDCPHKDKACSNCSEVGHLRRTCRKPAMGAGAPMSAPMPAGSGLFGSAQCFRCGLAGHSATTCPDKNSSCNNCGMVGHLKATCRQPQSVV